MTCGEARQFIFAFLDNELDSGLSLEVQQHIEHCPDCARECEIESLVRRRLSKVFRRTEELPEFEEAAVVGVLREGATTKGLSADLATHRSEGGLNVAGGARGTTRRLRLLWAWGAAAAVVVAAVAWWAVKPDGGADRRAARVVLADALVADFEHFVAEAKPLQFVSSDAGAVSEWLGRRTSLAVRVPAVGRATATLRGARKCKINGAPAAFAVYGVGEELASLVVIRAFEGAFDRMKRVDGGGHVHWVDRCRGHTVVACRRGDLIYAVVSRLSARALAPLMEPEAPATG